jgi:hypothetical protein
VKSERGPRMTLDSSGGVNRVSTKSPNPAEQVLPRDHIWSKRKDDWEPSMHRVLVGKCDLFRWRSG